MPTATPQSVIDVRVNQRKLNRMVADVRARTPEIAHKVVRALGLAVVSEVTRSLNGEEAGFPNPQRIDTGRYRAAWNTGIERATGQSVGPTPIVRDDPENRPQAGDGTGSITGTGAKARLVVRNNVRYAPYVEYGTKFMRPGGHLARGLLIVADRRRRITKAILAKALKR